MIAGTILTAAFMLLVTSRALWKSRKADPLQVNEPVSDNRTQLLKDLQNENKYFSKVLSHDLRSPLSSIVLLASYLKTKNQSSENNRYIELIEQSARKELEMMAILLSLMRSDSFKSEKLQKLGLKAAVDALLMEFENPVSQKQLRPANLISPELSVEADPDLFTLVLRTLIHHVLHYSDAAEPIEIKAFEGPHLTELLLEFRSSHLKFAHPDELFRSDHLLKNGSKAFPESVDLYFCRKLIRNYNGTVHVQATEQPSAYRLIVTLEHPGPESSAI